MADLTFLPWARAGVAGALNAAATQAGRNRPNVDVSLTVTKTLDNLTVTTKQHTVPMTMLGPGDVIGISPGQVIRTDPPDGSVGVDHQLFPAVEFDDPTLPWLFSPTIENASHQILPWLCLVVVPNQDGITLDVSTRRLTVDDAPHQLPDLREAWAWAHVQYAGDLDPDPVQAANTLAAHPTASLSRLLCPRQLQSNTRYFACVVPTFMAGRVAGLGGNPDSTAAHAHAWDGGEGTVTLPVYHSFSFTTGVGGDFLDLAQLLVHEPPITSTSGNGLGPRQLIVNIPPPAPLPTPYNLPMLGMLVPAQSTTGVPAPTAEPVPTEVATWIQTELAPTGSVPQLRPTLYGAVQAGIRPRDLSPANFGQLPKWWTTLNLDPRLRVAAALGKRVVATEREQLVASAWSQVDQALDVNKQLDRSKHARAVGSKLVSKHLANADLLSLLQLTSPQASRVSLTLKLTSGPMTGSVWSGTAWKIVREASPDVRLAAAVSPTYRRLSRPRGAHWRATPAPPRVQVPEHLSSASLLERLNPELTVPNRVLNGLVSLSALTVPALDPLQERAPDVTYPFGMMTPLAHVAPEAILPGASSIPPNTALTLETYREAIVAYMVGLNTEVNRLLLWRGIPANRRGTPFKYFWDQRGQAGSSADISTIESWGSGDTLESELGANPTLVLAIRAELLNRYPRTAVYATPAHPVLNSTSHTFDLSTVYQPIFTATLPPDLRLFGFNPREITPEIATGIPGAFIVLQQQATETRFGSATQAFANIAAPTGNYWTVAGLTPTSPPIAAPTDAGQVAGMARALPVLIAIHARALLPHPSSPTPPPAR